MFPSEAPPVLTPAGSTSAIGNQVAQVIGCKDASKIVHDVRNVMNELVLLRKLVELEAHVVAAPGALGQLGAPLDDVRVPDLLVNVDEGIRALARQLLRVCLQSENYHHPVFVRLQES